MHEAWSQLGTIIDPQNKPGSGASTFRNFAAFVQPLYNFFKIADGVLSKFHDADAFATAKLSYNQARELHADPERNVPAPVLADDLVAADDSVAAGGLVAAGGSVAAESPAAVESLKTVEESARTLVVERLGTLVDLLGMLQYLPDSCVLQTIEWAKVTKGDDQLLPQREMDMALTTATPEVTAIKQDIWQQSDAAKVRTKRVG